MKSPKLVAKMIRQLADRIENGSCGLDDQELMEVAMMIAHRKVNIEQVCNNYGISRPTFYRWVECGKLPQPKKDSGGKEYLWLDEVEMSVETWEQTHR